MNSWYQNGGGELFFSPSSERERHLANSGPRFWSGCHLEFVASCNLCSRCTFLRLGRPASNVSAVHSNRNVTESKRYEPISQIPDAVMSLVGRWWIGGKFASTGLEGKCMHFGLGCSDFSQPEPEMCSLFQLAVQSMCVNTSQTLMLCVITLNPETNAADVQVNWMKGKHCKVHARLICCWENRALVY